MTDHPKPSAEALAKADEICKKHGMLPGGYMRDSLAEDLEAFACATWQAAAKLVWEVEMTPDYVLGWECETTRKLIEAAMLKKATPAVATMLGQPITAEDLRTISKDGP